jgi:hypothetical protein
MKEIFVPHLNRMMKLGRVRPKPGRCKLKFGDYSQVALPPPPESCDYSSAAMQALQLVYLNDQLGDCTIAGAYHVVGTETGNAGAIFIPSNDQIIADYSACGGYVPGDASTDNGCDEETVLNYYQMTGFANGTKLAGRLALDATNATEVMQALYLFENLYFGLELPDSYINPFPSTAGFVWDTGNPDPDNGHCIIGVGYNSIGVQIDTWGLIGTLTWGAVANLCVNAAGGQLFVMLTPDQLVKSQMKSPLGLDWATLTADFKALPTRGGLS